MYACKCTHMDIYIYLCINVSTHLHRLQRCKKLHHICIFWYDILLHPKATDTKHFTHVNLCFLAWHLLDQNQWSSGQLRCGLRWGLRVTGFKTTLGFQVRAEICCRPLLSRLRIGWTLSRGKKKLDWPGLLPTISMALLHLCQKATRITIGIEYDPLWCDCEDFS